MLDFLRKFRYKDYTGSAESIARQIIAERWNNKYFEAGQEPHLSQFWIRDLAWSVKGLLALGYGQQVAASLAWALPIYARNGHLATTLSGGGRAYDVGGYGADSLPMLLYSLSQLARAGFEKEARELITAHLGFLSQEINHYEQEVFDRDTLAIRAGKRFSAPKDVLHVPENAVTNSFMLFLVKLIEQDELITSTGLPHPFPQFSELKERFVQDFWNNDHFLNHKCPEVDVFASADSNIWPYWTGVITEQKFLASSLNWIEKNNLNKPYPLKYHDKNLDHLADPISRLLLPNYQGDTIWTLSAPIYTELVARMDSSAAQKIRDNYLGLIANWGNYFEVMEPDGKSPMRGRFGFRSGSSMLWVAMWFEA